MKVSGIRRTAGAWILTRAELPVNGAGTAAWEQTEAAVLYSPEPVGRILEAVSVDRPGGLRDGQPVCCIVRKPDSAFDRI